MRVMVIVKATADSESGRMPDTECMAEMGRFNEALAKAGILLAADGLHASMRGKRVHFSGKDRSVVDGPFAETKELIAGYWLWQVKSMEEAVEWVKRCPNPMPGDSDIEIRPLLEAEDFSPAFIAELQAQKARLSAELDARQKS
ncbi:YciI family protein [Burkholderia cepacia]|uniref:YciI family protein n=1 Tax=Burkholderia cepacia TaxID=292 RepID=UPI00249EA2A7|nr:YciI family protein [Burkholderia cepacia]WGY72870.1 YciI family protein [Burkholderia cepacia]